ncbi:MAG: hypothetical protein AT709_01570 [Caldivirga sp. MG_3]|jgi:hypothetical protein|nr:MAG: hypothetical protein AT709_01570 [Caldivirga sp. MG_3]
MQVALSQVHVGLRLVNITLLAASPRVPLKQQPMNWPRLRNLNGGVRDGLSSVVAALVVLIMVVVMASLALILINLFKSYDYSSSEILSIGLGSLNCLNGTGMVPVSINGIVIQVGRYCALVTGNGTYYVIHPALGSPG